MALPPDDQPTDRIPLAEERVRIDTSEVAHGLVRIHLTTEEVEETLRATLHGRRASVQRVPIDRDVSEVPAVRQEGDVVVVPVVEEVLVVERRLRLREELHLRLETVEENVAVPVRRRVQHAEVSRVAADEAENGAHPDTATNEPGATAPPDPSPGAAAPPDLSPGAAAPPDLSRE